MQPVNACWRREDLRIDTNSSALCVVCLNLISHQHPWENGQPRDVLVPHDRVPWPQLRDRERETRVARARGNSDLRRTAWPLNTPRAHASRGGCCETSTFRGLVVPGQGNSSSTSSRVWLARANDTGDLVWLHHVRVVRVAGECRASS